MRTLRQSFRILNALPLPLAGILAVGILLWNLSPAFADTPGTFTTTGSMSNARSVHTATLLPSGKVLVAGGDSSGVILPSAELYDPATGVFSPTGSMGTARVRHTSTLLPNGKVLLAGGSPISSSGISLASAELYDPATGTFTPTGSMGTARQTHTATLLPTGKVLIAGGSSTLASAELYDPATGTFSPTGSMGTARQNHNAVLLPTGEVLVAGGFALSSNIQASAELYDPATGTFTPTGPMGTSRQAFSAALLPTGNVLVAGGITNGAVVLASAELYDPTAGVFSATGSMGTARVLAGNPAILLPNGKVLIAGGSSTGAFSTPLASAELYDPATGTFSLTGSMGTARSAQSMTLLPTGKVISAGGGNSSGTLASAELYCPEMPGTPGTFTSTGSLSTPREIGSPFNDARLLATGKVLIAAGDTTGGASTTTAELYDPAAGTFALTGPMTTARAYASSTVLPNGKVLYAGGVLGGPSFASAELYDPITGTFAPNAGAMVAGRALQGQILLPNGKVLLYGGSDGASTANCPTPSAELYDPVSEIFTTTGAMVICHSTPGSATLLPTGKVLIAGGTLGASGGFARLSDAELYDPTTGTFTVTGPMTIPRNAHTATLLPTGKVLIAGGEDISNLVSAELYDPTTGTFTATGSMAIARQQHKAVLLPTGKVLIAGGFSAGISLNSAELYDPATGTFSSTGSMGTDRLGFFSVLLPTGQVLAAGGQQQPSGARISAAELYSTAICPGGGPPTPATLILTPATATNPVGTQHCVTATVKDAGGNPVPGVTVRFKVTGSVNTSGSATTNASGQATFCYTGPALPGADAITAYADTNNNGVQDTGEPSGAATKTWVLPVTTPLCQIIITNGGRITAANGDKATFGGNAQSSATGATKGQEEYKDHGPAQPLNVQSLNVLAIVCEGTTQASIYGQATINGAGSFIYRINVKDLADPGAGQDTYWILLSNGYNSGEQKLEAGNVQIRRQ